METIKTLEQDVRYSMCTLCEAMCGLRVEVQNNQVLSVRGNDDDVLSRGYICPKGVAQKEIHEDPDRLKKPRIKDGDKWREATWHEAYDLVARKIVEIQSTYGNDGFGYYMGNPVGHDYKLVYALLAAQKVLNTRSVFSSNSVDAHPRVLTSFYLYGNAALLPVPDIERTRFLVIMGANPIVSNGSVMSSPDFKNRLRDIGKRGGKVVVIDPRETETAAKADQHLFIRPGTDALALLSVIHEMDRNGWVDSRAKQVAHGVDELLAAAKDYPPEITAQVTGVSPESLKVLTREFCEAPSATWYGRMGTSTQSFGCVSTWLIDAINLLSGNFDSPGGAMFTTPAIDLAGNAAKFGAAGSHGKWHSRDGRFAELGGELPVAAMADEIETPGRGQIRAMMIHAANPVLSNPNSARIEAALQQLDFLVCIDFYVNETTRLADVIIPPTGPLENEHYPMLELSYGIRNTARYCEAAVKAPADSPSDSSISLEILQRVLKLRGGIKSQLGALLLAGYQRLMESGRLLDLLLRLGPRKLRLKDLIQAPQGIDFGPLEPRGPSALATDDGKVNLFPTIYAGDLARLNTLLAGDQREPNDFSLISRRTLKSMNTWLHNTSKLMKGKPRCTLQINPVDSHRLGLSVDKNALVKSRVGQITVPIEITDTMSPGVVSLPFGWGHDLPGSELGIASTQPGVNFNLLADDMLYDAISGTSVLDGIPVTIQPCPG